MNAFTSAQSIEERGMDVLKPFLRKRAQDGQFVIVNKGPLSIFLQRSVGDALLNTSMNEIRSVEIKCEAENTHGNFFFETFSNKNLSDRVSHAERGSTMGWMQTLRADWLMYYFVADDELYVMDFFRLRQWAFDHDTGYPAIDKFPERLQGKRFQKNDTWGRCVPIDTIRAALGDRHFKLIHPARLLKQGEAA